MAASLAVRTRSLWADRHKNGLSAAGRRSRSFMWCLGLCLLNSFLTLLLKGSPAWRGWRGSWLGEESNHLLCTANAQRTLILKDINNYYYSFFLFFFLKKCSRTKSSRLWPQKVYPENNTLPLRGASLTAIYPGLYIGLLNSCYGNSVNRIRVTTEGFSGIVFLREKNGSLNASFTEISWKSKAPFSQVLSSVHDVLKSRRCSSYRRTGSMSGRQKDRRNCGGYRMPRGHISARRQRKWNHLEWLSG